MTPIAMINDIIKIRSSLVFVFTILIKYEFNTTDISNDDIPKNSAFGIVLKNLFKLMFIVNFVFVYK